MIKVEQDIPFAENVRFQEEVVAWSRADALIAAGLLLFLALWSALRLQVHATPVEDAIMLLRYAQHFSQGYGIRWNIDQPPVDGATDILYAVAIGALAHVTHLGVIAASRVLNMMATAASVLLIFVGARRLLHAGRWLSAAAAAYLVAGPAISLANGGFGAPCFALGVLLCWMAGLSYVLRRRTWGVALSMALLALVTGMTRPEGVLISMILLAATVYLLRDAASLRRWWIVSRPLVVSFLLVFGILGSAYFVWRWHYFGYPLPNPFYTKGGGHLYFGSVRHAGSNLLLLLQLGMPLLLLGWVAPRTRRLTTATAFVFVAFTCMWVLLNNWNNHLARFQYAIVPMLLLMVPVLSGAGLEMVVRPVFVRTASSLQKAALAGAGVLAFVVSCVGVAHAFPYQDVAWGMRIFATRLQPFASAGHTMAVTEAGALPFYSQWHTMDGLGLNDAYIAHHAGRLTEQYLDHMQPDLIMTHANGESLLLERLRGLPPPPDIEFSIYNMMTMDRYARLHGYTLAAVWGSTPCDVHLYWLRPGIPDYDAILHDLRDYPYVFLDNGIVAHDYHNELDSLSVCGDKSVHP